ncbi:MAG: CPBP family intramembrane glutamate endopeptidase, partial [Halothece sp.]
MSVYSWIKRGVLILLTIFAIAKVILSLGESFNQPQVQARLQLYQTNLILNAAELQVETLSPNDSSNLTELRQTFLGEDPYETAEKQYQEARELTQKSRETLNAQLQQLIRNQEAESIKIASEISQSSQPIITIPETSPEQKQLNKGIHDIDKFLNELDLKLGIIETKRGETDTALTTWQKLSNTSFSETASVLLGLWSEPPKVFSNTETVIDAELDSWFRYEALRQFYSIENRSEALNTLQTQEQEIAQNALVKLALVSAIPGLAGVIGVGLLLFLLIQFALKRQESILATNSGIAWDAPWGGETVWQVLIFGFFFIGQFLLPLLFGLSGFNPSGLDIRGKAVYVLISYLLMAAGGLLVLYFSIKAFLPLPKDWFRFQLRSSSQKESVSYQVGNWFFWGLGGYFIALPLVLLVSLINQQLWQCQGGSNPILFLALQAQD